MKDSFEGGTKYSSNIGGNLGLYYDRLRRIVQSNYLGSYKIKELWPRNVQILIMTVILSYVNVF